MIEYPKTPAELREEATVLDRNVSHAVFRGDHKTAERLMAAAAELRKMAREIEVSSSYPQ